MADDPYCQFAQLVIVGIAQCLRRSNDDRLAGVYAQRVEVLHVADGDAVVVLVAHDLILNLLPSAQGLLHQHLRRERESLLEQHVQLCLVVGKAGTQSAKSIGGTHNDGIAQVARSLAGILCVLAGFALYGLYVYLIQTLHEELAVFGVDDGLYRSAEHLHVVFLKNLVAIQLHTAVQRRLSTEGQQYAVRTFLLDDLLHEIRCHRQEIYLVCHALAGLHRSDVGVYEDRIDALFTQCLQSLRA